MAESINLNKSTTTTQEASIKIIAEEGNKIESKELRVGGNLELEGNIKINNTSVEENSYVVVEKSQIENCIFYSKSDKKEPAQIYGSLLKHVNFVKSLDNHVDLIKITDSEITYSDLWGKVNVASSIICDIRGEDIEAENTTYFGKDRTPISGKIEDLSEAPLKAVKKDPVVNVLVDKKKTNDIEL